MTAITPSGHGLGCIPQTPDPRDYIYLAPAIVLPARVDLRTSPYRPPIWDQGQLGSCTAFAGSRVAEQTYGIDGFRHEFEPSQLFIYYNARSLEGSTDQDAGASLRDTMKALAKQGMCAETWWPYSDADPGPFTKKPPAPAYQNAAKHLATSYQAVRLNLTAMCTCLATGYPFMVGIQVYDSFESAESCKTGIIPMPNTATESLLGGHAIAIEGYDNNHKWFICDNSWGASFGDKGSFYLPYAYLCDPNLSFDAWTIRRA